MKMHPAQCTKFWRKKDEQIDFVFFQNEVVGSKAGYDAFGEGAVRQVLSLVQWEDNYGQSRLKQQLLALINIFLPKRPYVGVAK